MGALPTPPIMKVLVPLVQATWPARGSWFSNAPKAGGCSTARHAPAIVSNATPSPQRRAPSAPPVSTHRNASSGASCANARGAGAPPSRGSTRAHRRAPRSYAHRSFSARAPSQPPNTYIVCRSTHAQCPYRAHGPALPPLSLLAPVGTSSLVHTRRTVEKR